MTRSKLQAAERRTAENLILLERAQAAYQTAKQTDPEMPRPDLINAIKQANHEYKNARAEMENLLPRMNKRFA